MTTPASDTVDSAFNPFSAAFRDAPRDYYPELLKTGVFIADNDGERVCMVPDHAHCSEVLRNYKLFSSEKRPDWASYAQVDYFNGLPVMNYSDPPDHIRRRKTVNAAFTPRRIQHLLDHADGFIDGLLDRFDAGAGTDFAAAVSQPLATELLLTCFMGIPREEQHIFSDFAATLSLLKELKPGEPKPQRYVEAWDVGARWCREAIASRRFVDDPTLLGVITEAAEARLIDEQETMAMMILMLTGGLNSSASISSTAILHMATHPAIAARIRQDPALASAHLEETLRIDAPVTLVVRFAREDCTLGGLAISRDMAVYAMVATACHDPAVFPAPASFDIDRPNLKDHMAFGHGIHTCIGNAITRGAVPVLINKVAGRYRELGLAPVEEPLRYESRTVRARHLIGLELHAAPGRPG